MDGREAGTLRDAILPLLAVAGVLALATVACRAAYGAPGGEGALATAAAAVAAFLAIMATTLVAGAAHEARSPSDRRNVDTILASRAAGRHEP